MSISVPPATVPGNDRPGKALRTNTLLADPSDVAAVVTQLNAGWYNVVSQAMGITDPSFQLAQGTLGLPTDSSGLFLMADAVPPSAVVAAYNPSGLSKRSSAYQLLLNGLLAEGGTSLAAILGDNYTNWLTFQADFFAKPPPADFPSPYTLLDVFKRFAMQRLNPSLASSAISVFLRDAQTPLNQAREAVIAEAGFQVFKYDTGPALKLHTYSCTLEAAQAAINSGRSVTIDYDSATASTALSRTTLHGSAGGFFAIFGGAGSSSLDQLNAKAASSGFTVTGTINKVATLATNPGSWFTSAELTRAYAAKNDNTVWDPASNAGSWDAFFGPDGSLARRVSSLVLVSDYSITVTSNATYSQEDLQTIQQSARGGMWPFFAASESSTHTTRYTLDAAGRLATTHTLNKGLIQIWGVTTADAPL